MRRWHRPPLWTRLLALVLAGGPFAVLWLQPGPHKPVPAAAAGIEVRIPSRVARVDPKPAVEAPRPGAPSPAAAPVRRAPAGPSPAPVDPLPAADTLAPVPAVQPPRPEVAASAPLQLGPDVIRAAGQASRSELQRLADSGGVDLGGAPASPQAALSGAMAGSARPDCIAPDPQGNLLSAFTIVFGAASGRCK